ncbi:hypothetical protein EU805_04100 [Salipiger sp. IMCC34102]|uniref:hypothetical protein n=1 Tax=Salipiger sp. IMCC34102 TaxID=2510647 RepID=UPI00101D67CE|nr:hypothetical protein [Salipiger sp. IMCC34102]RYH04547.1 hypothetical protein EU805_04100 [Salipiger sp. IMCC34102]
MKLLTLIAAGALLTACDNVASQPDARPDTILSGPVIPGTSASERDNDDAIIDVDPALEGTKMN